MFSLNHGHTFEHGCTDWHRIVGGILPTIRVIVGKKKNMELGEGVIFWGEKSEFLRFKS